MSQKILDALRALTDKVKALESREPPAGERGPGCVDTNL